MTGMLAFLLLAALICDLRWMIIPNRLTVPMMGLGVVAHTIQSGWAGFCFAMVGLLAGVAAVGLLYALRAVGAGDVKLFGAIGAWSGQGFALGCLLHAVLIAGLLGAGWLLLRKQMVPYLQRWGVAGMVLFHAKDPSLVYETAGAGRTRMPFMIAVVPAAILMWR